MKILINWVLSAMAIFTAAYVLPGVEVDDFVTALVVAVILGVINAIVKPVILILTLPINVITLGLFTFVINALLILLVGFIVPGFVVNGFLWALIFSILLSVINVVLDRAKAT